FPRVATACCSLSCFLRSYLPVVCRMPCSLWSLCLFFFNNTATTEIYTLSLHDALPIWRLAVYRNDGKGGFKPWAGAPFDKVVTRSEEHTSELQSHLNLVCRLLLEKKKKSRISKRSCLWATGNNMHTT